MKKVLKKRKAIAEAIDEALTKLPKHTTPPPMKPITHALIKNLRDIQSKLQSKLQALKALKSNNETIMAIIGHIIIVIQMVIGALTAGVLITSLGSIFILLIPLLGIGFNIMALLGKYYRQREERHTAQKVNELGNIITILKEKEIIKDTNLIGDLELRNIVQGAQRLPFKAQ